MRSSILQDRKRRGSKHVTIKGGANCQAAAETTKKMPTYKFTYFGVEARGELSRFIFAQAGQDYEDIRTSSEDWAAMKPTTPFGQLPTLDVDGEILAGSGPIGRYLAENLGLAGSNAIENTKIAGIKDVQDEANQKLIKAFFAKEDKEAATKEVVKNVIPKYLGLMEKTIKGNPVCQDWLFGSKLTYVDLHLYLIVDSMKLFKEDNLLDDYPGVERVTSAVGKLPNIVDWVEKRPPRTFGPPVA